MKLLIVLLTLSFSTFAKISCPDYKAVVCHAGSEINPNYVEVCVSFSSLYGHLAEHAMDYYGECGLKNLKDPFVCNAGLRHKDSESKICIRKDEDQTTFVTSCGNSENCECMSGIDNYLFDYFTVTQAEYEPFSEVAGIYSTQSLQALKDKYKVATTDPGHNIIQSEGGLAFFLGSEKMNAEYFVDTCWVNTTGTEEYSLNFDYSSQIYSSVYQGKDYPVSSNLVSKYLLYCDTNYDGIFDYQTASLVSSTEYMPYRNGQISTFNFDVSNAEFCFVRQSFVETNLNYMRPWDMKKIVIANNLESEEVPVVNPQIDICHVSERSKNSNNGTNNNYSQYISQVQVGTSFQTVSGNKIYECTNLRFNDSDHLKSYISIAKDAQEFRDIHQHDYVGTCYSECGPIHGNGAN